MLRAVTDYAKVDPAMRPIVPLLEWVLDQDPLCLGVEAEWHMRFDNLRVRGEWFIPHSELLDAIREATR